MYQKGRVILRGNRIFLGCPVMAKDESVCCLMVSSVCGPLVPKCPENSLLSSKKKNRKAQTPPQAACHHGLLVLSWLSFPPDNSFPPPLLRLPPDTELKIYREFCPEFLSDLAENSAQSVYGPVSPFCSRFDHTAQVPVLTQIRQAGNEDRINASVTRECMNKGAQFAFLERSFFKPTVEPCCGGHDLKTSGARLQLQFHSSPWASLRLNPFLDR